MCEFEAAADEKPGPIHSMGAFKAPSSGEICSSLQKHGSQQGEVMGRVRPGRRAFQKSKNRVIICVTQPWTAPLK